MENGTKTYELHINCHLRLVPCLCVIILYLAELHARILVSAADSRDLPVLVGIHLVFAVRSGLPKLDDERYQGKDSSEDDEAVVDPKVSLVNVEVPGYWLNQRVMRK